MTSNKAIERAADADLERMTTKIAREHGCDRGTFTVCWGELEDGKVCQCKEDARAALQRMRDMAAASAPAAGASEQTQSEPTQ